MVGVIALELTEMVFENGPGLFVLYLTVISPVLPGVIGSLGQVGVVHPQEALTVDNNNGTLPLFVNLKVHIPSLPLAIVP